jgi:hypothetical protein
MAQMDGSSASNCEFDFIFFHIIPSHVWLLLYKSTQFLFIRDVFNLFDYIFR